MNLLQGTDGRTRLLIIAPAIIGLFALAWWGLGALGLIEAGSSGGQDNSVIIEPLATATTGPATRGAPTSTTEPTLEPEGERTATPERGVSLDAPTAATDTPTPIADSPTIPPQPSPVATQPPPPPATGSLAGARIWSNGDSTSYFMSVAFINSAANLGAIPTQPEPEYKISSGLLRPEFFDWPAYLASEMALHDPQIVVFMVGANDAYVGMPLDTYATRVAAVMDQLSGRRLIWVSQPNMGRADLAASIPAMNEVYRTEAASRPWVTYVDAWALTSDASGAFTSYLLDETGALVLARGEDGVHFTSAGGAVLARAVLAVALGGG